MQIYFCKIKVLILHDKNSELNRDTGEFSQLDKEYLQTPKLTSYLVVKN